MRRRKLILAVISLSFFLSLEISQAQHVQIFSDQQWIELGIDLLRKGIQEEDTMKINMALAPEVSLNGEKATASAQVAQRFQTLFNGSANRTMRLAKPAFSRPDSPRRNSDFWDFDILDPKITIKGDSAIVECELVLWGAPPDGVNRGPGRKVTERLVFISLSPPDQSSASEKVPHVVEAEDGTLITIKGHPWPSMQFPSRFENSRKSWKLAGFESIVHILEIEKVRVPVKIELNQGKK